ncbi:chorismate-binding protein [Nesterenkonia sp. LB17]|uniref:isochorismate synthase n=1 Tax=unclassified Nesterenkonia TaxID=2629769 RepID=UPI001F4CA2A0|nr:MULTISPECIES: chorismate-binding protein [unclassified Nesterenkonia]MCH8560603.1 chorismate-binding protein [Nesterenkonia sp. DZ6]MCH8565919.1 chorismate-binding protein [Nesterenkonia sp. LB17]
MTALPGSLDATTLVVDLPPGTTLADMLPALDPSGVWLLRGEGLIGLGTAAHIRTRGAERFAELAEWHEQHLAPLAQVSPLPEELTGIPGAGPVALTSITYSSASAADSHLILPELILGSAEGRAWITTVIRPSALDESFEAEDDDDAALRRVHGLLARHSLQLQGRRLSLVPSHSVGSHSDGSHSAGQTDRLDAAAATSLIQGTHSEQHYLRAVRSGVQAIGHRRLEKLVLARDVVVAADAPLAPGPVLAALAADYADCWTYLAGDVLGATPEMLVKIRGRELSARVLAGTVDGGTGLEQARAMLLEDPKQRDEHRLAAQSLLDQLAPVAQHLHAQDPPAVLQLPNVFHLSTDVTGQLTAQTPALLVAERAHPTAAICGTPTATAAELISTLEGLDRGAFSGPVGWIDAYGNADFGIALRGGILEEQGTQIRLFAGCGIVAGSVPEEELAETWAKMRPMLGALGVRQP